MAEAGVAWSSTKCLLYRFTEMYRGTMCTEMNGEVRTEKSTVSVNSGFKPHPPLYQLCGERLILADHDDQQSYSNVLILIELHSALKDDREKF